MDSGSSASPDQLDSFPHKSNGGDVSPKSLSWYSSCRGETDFESANSVMPSFYSTSFDFGL